MSYSLKLREEELKNKVANDYFGKYDWTKIIGNIDFCISNPTGDKEQLNLEIDDFSQTQSYLWAETKKGNSKPIYESLVQLILTIGKARTFEKYLPPIFLGAFDAEKIAFIEYDKVSDIFSKNDFNWNVTPSDHKTKSFKEVYELVESILKNDSLIFKYSDDTQLKQFIKDNFKLGKKAQRIAVTKNNFTTVYYRWREQVKDSINIDWESARKFNILDSDFYLADLLSENNESLKDSLYVLLKTDRYIYGRIKSDLGDELFRSTKFKDNQIAHKQFWSIYKRPPRKEFWDYIIERRDLLVPQDIRERKGSFFTPQQWVALSQEYLTNTLGDDWQDEYIIWDCCAGTGNLLNGLTNKYNIFASTIDKADVDVMKDRIKNGANLLESHIFQFDFLNDDLYGEKVPDDLKAILKSPEKRKKLVIYINPPYAEATSSKSINAENSRHKSGVSNNLTYEKYIDKVGRGINEVFIQFLMRIHYEIKGCILGHFSTLKILQSDNFNSFRNAFNAKFLKGFMVKGNTFDNVKGNFPIGFFIWNQSENEIFKKAILDVYDLDKNKNPVYLQKKIAYALPESGTIMKWIQKYYDKDSERLSYMVRGAADFQNNQIVFLTLSPSQNVLGHSQTHNITKNNLMENAVYFGVRKCMKKTWINNQDNFINPNNDKWNADNIFKTDCFAFMLFDSKNTIKSKDGTNNWIPFTEKEVESKGRFKSHFMTDYIKANNLVFSDEAKAVFDAGRELYRYYHSKQDSNPNASFYDIRLYFQGVNSKGKMNSSSSDEEYMRLLNNLTKARNTLALKIQPKVFEYGFLV